jgi:hypothetical protein
LPKLQETLSILGLSHIHLESGQFDISQAVPWGLADTFCLVCGSAILYCIKDSKSESLRDVFSFCLAMGHRVGVERFSHQETELIQSRLTNCLNSMGELGLNLDFLLRALGELGGLKIEISASTSQTAPSAEVPAGYKSVGWIKLQEAELILKAAEAKTSQTSSATPPTFRVDYFEPTSPEARKYYSTTRLVRLRRGEVSKSLWIRAEEAETIIEAWSAEKSINFAHIAYGNGGTVDYFEPNSEVAQRFRSCTRLLRKY